MEVNEVAVSGDIEGQCCWWISREGLHLTGTHVAA
jgi:hypothetical protein